MDLNGTDITNQVSLYQNISIILIIISITLLIAAGVLWFVFDIPHSIKVVARLGYRKKIKRVPNVDGDKSNKVIISWNTSGLLKARDDEEDATVVLEDTTNLLDDETVVLDVNQNFDKIEGFEIEENIKMLGTDKSL